MSFVSSGGISGGIRCVQRLKQAVTAMKMMPIVEVVNVPFFTKYSDDQDNFTPDEIIEKSAQAMLKELAHRAEALKTVRG